MLKQRGKKAIAQPPPDEAGDDLVAQSESPATLEDFVTEMIKKGREDEKMQELLTPIPSQPYLN